MSSNVLSIVFVGCGIIGRSLLTGLLEKHKTNFNQVWVVDPNPVARKDLPVNCSAVAIPDALPSNLAPDLIILATKPQDMSSVIQYYRRFISSAIFMSVAAGRTIEFFEENLGTKEIPIVRAMPNIAASVKRSVTVACANMRAERKHRAMCNLLLEAIGTVVWIEDETLMSVVTAISGSGPAYVFLLTEILTDIGRKAGLTTDLAEHLARMVVIGTGELLYRHTQENVQTLRQNVTSPAGTTAAALMELMDPQNGLDSLLTRAISAAIFRSEMLSR